MPLIQFTLLPEKRGDSILETISYIPFIGAIPSYFIEKSLEEKLQEMKSPYKKLQMVEWIKESNLHKTKSIARDLFDVALLIAGFATGLIRNSWLGGFLPLVMLAVTFLDLNDLYTNKKALRTLQQNNEATCRIDFVPKRFIGTSRLVEKN